jgi:hypothetical protein
MLSDLGGRGGCSESIDADLQAIFADDALPSECGCCLDRNPRDAYPEHGVLIPGFLSEESLPAGKAHDPHRAIQQVCGLQGQRHLRPGCDQH